MSEYDLISITKECVINDVPLVTKFMAHLFIISNQVVSFRVWEGVKVNMVVEYMLVCKMFGLGVLGVFLFPLLVRFLVRDVV